MIHTTIHPNVVLEENTPFKVISYFGEDVPEQFKNTINKECTVSECPCVTIGIEYNEYFDDWYYIVYNLVSEDVTYVSCHDSKFTNTIK